MNKILIPAILSVTILMAGMFAFMPVGRVMTAHLPIVGAANIAPDSIDGAQLADTITLDATTAVVTGAGVGLRVGSATMSNIRAIQSFSNAATADGATVTFPTAFATAPEVVICMTTTTALNFCSTSAITATNFVANIKTDAGLAGTTQAISVIAIDLA